MSPRKPRVVAELGRPETPEETAARKAENSRNYRMRKTVNNLVFSLLVTVGLVIVIVIAVPRGELPPREGVNWSQIADSIQTSRSEVLADPQLGDRWSANYAEIRSGGDGVQSWNIGLAASERDAGSDAPKSEFIGITQGFDANATWLAGQLKNTAASGTTVIEGVTWTIYDNRESSEDVGNVEYALTTEAGTSTFIIFGTASDESFAEVARAIAPQVAANATNSEQSTTEEVTP